MTIFVITLHGIKTFLLNFLMKWGGGWISVGGQFPQFLGEKPKGLHKISVCGGSPHGEIGCRGLCFAQCLFICLLFVCLLFVCVFAFYLLIQSCLLGHASIRGERTGEGGMGRKGDGGWLFLCSCVVVFIILFSCGFDAGCDEKLAFIFNLLLLLLIAIYIKV